MMSWYRLVYFLGLALVEATPPALLLTVVGGDSWGTLIVAVLAGALADWVLLRRLSPQAQRPALAATGLLVALWVVKAEVAGVGPLSGWGQAIGQLLDGGTPQSLPAYPNLLLGLYCFWRGTRLTLHDSITLHRLFRLSMVAMMIIVFLRFFSGGPGARLAGLASTEVLIFFAVGLLTIALSSASEEREAELRRMGWRGLATLLGAVALVMVLGVLVAALFGREAAAMIGLLWRGLIMALALIIVPIIYVFAGLVERLLQLLNINSMTFDSSRLQLMDSMLRQQEAFGAGGLPPWAEALIRGFCAIVPVLLIVALFFLARRRNRRGAGADEERESLWSWEGLAEDLLGLFGRRAGRAAGGLRDALARLRGDDPASRIRRSYIRLLLLGEERSIPRSAPQTPHEYAPVAQSALPAAAHPVDTLTDAYERARYRPGGATSADADAAERAWGALEQANQRKKG
jgi:hypothetical protein